jgi:hypothetical protein
MSNGPLGNSAAKGTIQALGSTLDSRFDKFLYASIGESKDETLHSVLSAIARQNLDPWEEADRLSHLSRRAAIDQLASIIAVSTVGLSEPPDPHTNAMRLADLLPGFSPLSALGSARFSKLRVPNAKQMVLYLSLALMVAVLFLIAAGW